jgi:hypothetical protein
MDQITTAMAMAMAGSFGTSEQREGAGIGQANPSAGPPRGGWDGTAHLSVAMFPLFQPDRKK